MTTFSKHAIERLENRMRGIVSPQEILAAVYEAGEIGTGETALIVKRLGRTLKVLEGSSYSEGDTVIAVYKRRDAADAGCVTTVELRGSWQKPAARWARYLDLTV